MENSALKFKDGKIDHKGIFGDYVLYGPYHRQRGKNIQKVAQLRNPKSGKSMQLMYKDCIMALHLGRKLTNDEVVEQIDGDPLNTSITNLKLVQKKKMRSIIPDATPDTYEEVECVVCHKTFTRLITYNSGAPVHKQCLSNFALAGKLRKKAVMGAIATEAQTKNIAINVMLYIRREQYSLAHKYATEEEYYANYEKDLAEMQYPERIITQTILVIPVNITSSSNEVELIRRAKNAVGVTGIQFTREEADILKPCEINYINGPERSALRIWW